MRRRSLLLVPLLAALLLVAAWLLANVWLDGAGGRRALERGLGDRLGLPVRLQGDFDIELLPRLGVSGTDWSIGNEAAGAVVGSGQYYEVALAVRPLIQGRVHVESLRLAGGHIDLGRLPDTSPPGAGIRMPEVDRFEVRDIELAFGADSGNSVRLQELAVEGFAESRDTPFRLVLDPPGGLADGTFRWEPGNDRVYVRASVAGAGPGRWQVQAEGAPAAKSGSLRLRWTPPEAGVGLDLEVVGAMQSGGLRLASVSARAGGQAVQGSGCLLLTGEPVLNLELAAERIDLDSLPDVPVPVINDAGAQDSSAAARFNVRLQVGELIGKGAIARQAILALGDDPDCGALPVP